MSNIDKRALREAAVRAGGVKWQYMRATQHSKAYITDDKGSTVINCTDGDVPAKCAGFLESANPAAVLALLDELEAKDRRIEEEIGRANREHHRGFMMACGHLKEHANAHYADAAEMEIEALRKRIAELEARAFNPAILDVIAERQRQQSVEGWTPEHDDLHDSGELAGAAACYAHYTNARGWVFPTNPGDYQSADEPDNWPWDRSWWKPTNPRRDLVKAGALILAEIERIDRAAGINVEAE